MSMTKIRLFHDTTNIIQEVATNRRVRLLSYGIAAGILTPLAVGLSIIGVADSVILVFVLVAIPVASLFSLIVFRPKSTASHPNELQSLKEKAEALHGRQVANIVKLEKYSRGCSQMRVKLLRTKTVFTRRGTMEQISRVEKLLVDLMIFKRQCQDMTKEGYVNLTEIESILSEISHLRQQEASYQKMQRIEKLLKAQSQNGLTIQFQHLKRSFVDLQKQKKSFA